jgi:hypothetical protein
MPVRYKHGWRWVDPINMAVRHTSCQSFTVPHINIDNRMAVHEANLLHMYADFSRLEDRCIGGFREYEGKLSNFQEGRLRAEHKRIVDYVTLAGIDSEPPGIEGRLEHVRYERMKRYWQYMDPKQVAKRERAAARKLARQALLGD